MSNIILRYPFLKWSPIQVLTGSPIQVLTGLNIGLTSVIGLSLMLTLRYAVIGNLESVFRRLVECWHLMKGGDEFRAIELRASL